MFRDLVRPESLFCSVVFDPAQNRILLAQGWRRQWHRTPVLLPGKSHGWRSLEGCSPWGHWESDTTERLPFHFHFSLSCIGEGNGNPLQCSCLENPRDGGAWWASVYGVAQSRTRLKRLSSSTRYFRISRNLCPVSWGKDLISLRMNWEVFLWVWFLEDHWCQRSNTHGMMKPGYQEVALESKQQCVGRNLERKGFSAST